MNTNPPRLSTILFDLDGTLTDPAEGITRCIQAALEATGRKPPPAESLRWCIGPPLRDSFVKLGAGPDEVEPMIDAYRVRFRAVGMYENHVYTGIPELLSRLRSDGVRLHVATSKPRDLAVPILQHFSLDRFFEHVFGSEMDGRLSDKGELLAHAQSIARFRADTSALVGDRDVDVCAARARGVFAIGALWGYGAPGELEAAGAQALVESPSDLLQALVR